MIGNAEHVNYDFVKAITLTLVDPTFLNIILKEVEICQKEMMVQDEPYLDSVWQKWSKENQFKIM